MNVIGTNIINRRRELDMKQIQLARRLGYANAGLVCMIEKGDRKPTESMLARLALALNTDVADLTRVNQ